MTMKYHRGIDSSIWKIRQDGCSKCILGFTHGRVPHPSYTIWRKRPLLFGEEITKEEAFLELL